MRLPIAIGLIALLATPLSHAQHPTRLPSTAPPSRSQTASSTAHSATPADRPLSTAPEWAALASRSGDSTETDPALRAQRIEGGIHLTFGVIFLGGGAFSGVVAYKLFTNPGDSDLIRRLSFIIGGTAVVSAIGFIVLGIQATMRGIRILQGKAPPIGWLPQPPPPSLPSQHTTLSLTISL